MSIQAMPLEIQYLFQSYNPLSSGETAHIRTLLAEAENDSTANAQKVANLQYLLSAVRRIPEDVLAVIFEYGYYIGNEGRQAQSIFREDFYCWTTRPLRQFGSVCSKWRFTTQNFCAHLWTRVCLVPDAESYHPRLVPDSLHTLESQIQYSRDLPLDICIPFGMADPSSAFNLLRKESHRWRSAFIVLDDAGYHGALHIHPRGITLDAPELIDFKLKFKDGSYGIDGEEDILPFSLIAPKLKKAEFWYGTMERFIKPTNFPWQQLTHVSFISGNVRKCNHLMHLIQNTVEFLSVVDTYKEFEDDDYRETVEDPPHIIFPKLHTLELPHVGSIPGTASRLFMLSTAPALRSLRWETYGIVHYEDDMIEFLHRSACRLEHFTYTQDGKEGLAEDLNKTLVHMPFLLSLGFGGWDPTYYGSDGECDRLIDSLSTGPDETRSLCPLLVETHFVY